MSTRLVVTLGAPVLLFAGNAYFVIQEDFQVKSAEELK